MVSCSLICIFGCRLLASPKSVHPSIIMFSDCRIVVASFISIIFWCVDMMRAVGLVRSCVLR